MRLSVILYIDKAETALQSMESLMQNRHFKSTELIAVDPYCDESTREAEKLSLKYDNIIYIKKESCSAQAACNAGLDTACGDLINFSLSSSLLSKNALDAVLSAASKPENAQVNLFTLRVKGISTVNDIRRGVRYRMQSGTEGLNNIREKPEKINLVLQSYFIRAALAKSERFDEGARADFYHQYLLNLLAKDHNVFSLLKHSYTYCSLLENSFTACDLARDKSWYTESLRHFFIPFMKALKEHNGTVPVYIQIAVLYLIWAKCSCNFFDRDREALSREEAFEFYNAVCECMSYINDNVIFQNYPCNYTIARYLKTHFYNGKCKFLGIEPCGVKVIESGWFAGQLVLDNKEFSYYSPQRLESIESRFDALDLCTLGLTENQNVIIRVIDHINGRLEIDFDFVSYLLENSDAELYVKAGQDKYLEYTPTQVYSFNKYFGITISRQPTYHLSVPVNKLLNRSIQFGFRLGGKEYPVKIQFRKVYSRLSNSSASYYMLDSQTYLAYRNNTLYCGVMSTAKRVFSEVKFFVYRFLRTPVPFLTRVKYLFIRLVYWLIYPFMHKKRIWITFDKLYKGGDNGEYMFRYCMAKNDGIDIYYILNKDAADYPKMKKEFGRRILTQTSLRLKLLTLYSETILATHATVFNYLGYNPKTQIFVRDLFRAVIVCIQHGLTIQKIAQYQNRLFDDTRLYTLASRYEKENVLKPVFGFFGNELKMTGLARYDGLKNNDQKQILITPTWRRNIVNQSIAFVKKTHNDSFKNSEYFKIYNSLINDSELIACAKETGYRLIYLLHPAMSSQAEDFDRNDDVTLLQATGDMSYEKILTESSLMVTDYSGVQFDFAYQRKPLVYYHPDTLPPHYGEGGLIYETMGFGPICKNHKEIIETLCRYMKNGCVMEDEYIRRADDFFDYDDFNSCERIYNEVIRFMADPENF